MTELKGVGLRNWKTDKMPEEFNRLFERMHQWDLCCMVDGTYWDRHTGKQLHPNHLRCMLKNEYRAAGGELRGKNLDKFLDCYLAAIHQVCRQVVAEGRGSKVEVDLVKDYV